VVLHEEFRTLPRDEVEALVKSDHLQVYTFHSCGCNLAV
jgi:hypothetical protein